MDLDDISPKPAQPKPLDLENMSIEELSQRIQDLEAEILRIKEIIARKQAVRTDADALFRQ